MPKPRFLELPLPFLSKEGSSSNLAVMCGHIVATFRLCASLPQVVDSYGSFRIVGEGHAFTHLPGSMLPKTRVQDTRITNVKILCQLTASDAHGCHWHASLEGRSCFRSGCLI